MKEHITKKQIVECLKDSEITFLDKQTGDELSAEILEELIELLKSKRTQEEFKILVEVFRFKKQIEQFILENDNEEKDFEFYAHHSTEINKEKEKAIIFQKKFHIIDLSSFKQEFKNKSWYLPEFYEEKLRDGILNAQEGKCGLCNKDVTRINPHLHHIDYNKQNCSRENLVFLCPRCHGKSNSNREFWKNLLTERQHDFITSS